MFSVIIYSIFFLSESEIYIGEHNFVTQTEDVMDYLMMEISANEKVIDIRHTICDTEMIKSEPCDNEVVVSKAKQIHCSCDNSDILIKSETSGFNDNKTVFFV